MQKFIHDLRVVSKKRINADYFVLELTHSKQLPDMFPGQFVEARVDGAPNTFLRRPISIFDVDYEHNTLKLLIQIVGEGTRNLSYLEPYDYLNLVYPLGNSFSMPQNDRILLVGGGCGMAPLLYTARYFRDFAFVPTILLGARNNTGILEQSEYEKYGDVHIATEDGSLGVKGFVTNHPLMQTPQKFDKVYACGPERMMKAVAIWAQKNKIHCEVSLENLMACGVGACLCCVQKTVRGNECVCTEGPVFNVNDLKW
jgi:dihydroorotate dehydrogenase electron transfer subunit